MAADEDGPRSQPRPVAAVRDFLAGISRVAGLGRGPLADEEMFAPVRTGEEKGFDDDNSDVPEVLVAGATGETGRIVVRKLLLRGYKVRVLVRNLYSSTLDMLGTGVSFVKGDLADYNSLLDCVGDVDKVVCAVGAGEGDSAEEVDFRGVSNLIRAFHDGRMQHFGPSEATKLRLFDFSREGDMDKWRVVAPTSGTGFSSVDPFEEREARASFMETTGGRKAFLGQIFNKYSGVAEMRTAPAKINLLGFSGLVLRCIGDGKGYRYVLRTASGVRSGVEYVASFSTRTAKWETKRLPIASFVAYDLETGAVRKDAIALDRSDIRQMAIQWTKPVDYLTDDGRFYLGIDYIKTYRTQEEPDFVLLSCATVSTVDVEKLNEEGLRDLAAEDSCAWKYVAERRLRNSGLTYCIVRPGKFTEQPGGNKSLILEQGGESSGVISRADVAEICVKALLDPRACNVTFDAFESMYAPTAQTPTQDLSSLLGRLRPNS
jgi:uncharacterized protein YbjT (DUF2867 family)